VAKSKTGSGVVGLLAIGALIGGAGLFMKTETPDRNDRGVVVLTADWTGDFPEHLSYIVAGGPNVVVSAQTLASRTNVHGDGHHEMSQRYEAGKLYSVSVQPAKLRSGLLATSVTCEITVNGVSKVRLRSDSWKQAVACTTT
jgi:hypothetical protein